jgi:hypothetical protein
LKKTFEHLLGLSLKDALAIQKSSGIFDVRVTFTSAPAPLSARPAQPGAVDPASGALLPVTAAHTAAASNTEPPYDPLLEPELTDGMLTEARVIGVRDDGSQLLVSRFHVSPKGETCYRDTNEE